MPGRGELQDVLVGGQAHEVAQSLVQVLTYRVHKIDFGGQTQDLLLVKIPTGQVDQGNLVVMKDPAISAPRHGCRLGLLFANLSIHLRDQSRVNFNLSFKHQLVLLLLLLLGSCSYLLCFGGHELCLRPFGLDSSLLLLPSALDCVSHLSFVDGDLSNGIGTLRVHGRTEHHPVPRELTHIDLSLLDVADLSIVCLAVWHTDSFLGQ